MIINKMKYMDKSKTILFLKGYARYAHLNKGMILRLNGAVFVLSRVILIIKIVII